MKPTRDLAVLEITEEAPPLEKALPPGIPVLPDSWSEVASWIKLIGLPGPYSKVISSWFLYMNENTVNNELSVVPEIGIENLLPSSS